MNNKLQSIENVTEYINAFAIKLKNEGFVKKSTTDAKSHFARWLTIQLEKKKNENTKIRSDNSKEARERFIMQEFQNVVGKSPET